jgi:hypothetical protein
MPLGGSSCAKSSEYPARRGLKLESTWKRSFPCQPITVSVKICKGIHLPGVEYLICLTARALRVKDGPISLDIADVEELSISKTMFPTSGDVRLHVVQVPEFLRKCNVAFIRESGTAEDDNTVLYIQLVRMLHTQSKLKKGRRKRKGITLVTA